MTKADRMCRPCYPARVRSWYALALVGLLSCDRPKVLSSDEDAGAAPVDAGAHIDLASAKQLVSKLATLRSGTDDAALALSYAKGARILAWRGSSSWSYSPTRWAKLLVERHAKVTVQGVDLVSLGRHVRVVARLLEEVGDGRTSSLVLFDVEPSPTGWSIHAEAEIDRTDLDPEPLSYYSRAVMADLSYRADPEIAVLRIRGRSSSTPELAPANLAKGTCPTSCTAAATTDLVTFSLSGDKLVDTRLDSFRGGCAELPVVDLEGAFRVFEREALILSTTPRTCEGATASPALSIHGVRGTTTERILAMDDARIVEINGEGITIEYRPSSGAAPETARFVPRKEEDRILFRPEPKPTVKATP